MPAVSAQDEEAIKQISKLGLKSRIYTFARAMKSDIDKALECGAHGVIIEVPIGYPKLVTQFGWTWKDVLAKSAPIIRYAQENGLHAVFFPYDTTRARADDLENLCKGIMQNLRLTLLVLLIRWGVQRLRPLNIWCVGLKK